jgi:hypothetical protein
MFPPKSIAQRVLILYKYSLIILSYSNLKAEETKKCRHRDDDEDDLVKFCQL